MSANLKHLSERTIVAKFIWEFFLEFYCQSMVASFTLHYECRIQVMWISIKNKVINYNIITIFHGNLRCHVWLSFFSLCFLTYIGNQVNVIGLDEMKYQVT